MTFVVHEPYRSFSRDSRTFGARLRHRLCRTATSRVLRFACVLVFALVLSSSTAHAQTSARAKRGWLGVGLNDNAQGTVITRIIPGSPAYRALLQVGDRLVSIDQQAIGSARDTVNRIGTQPPGARLTLRVLRKNVPLDIPVELEAAPSAEQLFRRMHIGRPAPALQGLRMPLTGESIRLQKYRGKVLVLDFWSTYCPSCRSSAQHLNRWQQDYGSQGVAILGLSPEPSATVLQGANRFGIQYPVASDTDAQTAQAYGISMLPTLLIIDAKGIVRDVVQGYHPRAMRDAERTLRSLLAAASTPAASANPPKPAPRRLPPRAATAPSDGITHRPPATKQR